MLHRRQILAAVPLTAFAMSADTLLRAQEKGASTSLAPQTAIDESNVIGSPPVVQHRTISGFTVVFKTNELATAWVDWGIDPNALDQRASAQHHGLKSASDIALNIRVEHGSDLSQRDIYYRITAIPLKVEGRQVQYGEEDIGSTHKLRPAVAREGKVNIAIVNDTHENAETIAKLAERVEALDPDLLIWNGDTTNDFHPEKDVAGILLRPGQTGSRDEGGWASTRPLVFVPGNHDVRGRLAYQLQTCLPGWPGGAGNSGVGVPYCSMHRIGPLAFVTLDTGEDKPDAHPSFQGTAAYEPYREQQGTWLKEIVKHSDFQSAPYRIAICHIPLRGLSGHPDGTVMEGFAYYSGFGARHWLNTLVQSNVRAIVSGHMHRHRLDAPMEELPAQIVLGGPQLDSATITRIIGDENRVDIVVENWKGKELIRFPLT